MSFMDGDNETLLYLWETILITAVIYFFIPSLSVTFRRLHDSGCSGWAILLPLIPTIGSLMLLGILCSASIEEDTAEVSNQNTESTKTE